MSWKNIGFGAFSIILGLGGYIWNAQAQKIEKNAADLQSLTANISSVTADLSGLLQAQKDTNRQITQMQNELTAIVGSQQRIENYVKP